MGSERIISVLMKTFDIEHDAASAILDEAEDLAEEATGAHQYTTLVKGLAEEKRVQFIEGLYFVTFADGEKCPFEDAFVQSQKNKKNTTEKKRKSKGKIKLNKAKRN